MSMENILNANTEDVLNDLSEILDKCRECDCIATLKKFIERSDGELNHIDIQQNAAVNVTSTVFINDKFIYVMLHSSDMSDLRQIKEMWMLTLQRGTKNALSGKTNDYALVIDLIKQELERSLVYTLSFMQPVFVSLEDDTLTLAFETENMFFGKDTVTLEEIEYAEEVDRDRYEYTDNENESEYTETEEFISTDEYIS